MIVRNGYGETDPAVISAALPELPPPTVSLKSYFWLAVGAGVTVWFVTRALDRIWR